MGERKRAAVRGRGKMARYGNGQHGVWLIVGLVSNGGKSVSVECEREEGTTEQLSGRAVESRKSEAGTLSAARYRLTRTVRLDR